MNFSATAPPAPAKPIDLLRGHPSTSLLPTDLLKSAATSALSNPAFLPADSYAPDRHPLHYGPDLGNREVRAELGRWVGERYGARATPASHINLTCGASYSLLNALQQLTSPVTGYTRRAFVVSPTYFLAARILEDAGFADRLVAIPARDHGRSIDFAALLRAIETAEREERDVSLEEGLRPLLRGGQRMQEKKIYRYVMYCVPTYSNPTGETWTLETRTRLLEIARTWDVLVISDDVYDFLGNEGDESALLPPPSGRLLPRLVELDRESLPPAGETQTSAGAAAAAANGADDDGADDDGANAAGVYAQNAGNTLSNCSFSKLLGPGLRCGWVESASARLAFQLGSGGANHSGGCPSHLASVLVHALLLPPPPPSPSPSPTPPKTTPRPRPRPVDAVIDGLRAAYTRRCAVARAAIAEHLPATTQVRGGNGGFFLWLVLPERISAREVVRLAVSGGGAETGGERGERGERGKGGEGGEGGEGREGGGVVVAPGDMSECPGSANALGWGDRCVRVSISYCEEAEIAEGLRRLGAAVRRWELGERPEERARVQAK